MRKGIVIAICLVMTMVLVIACAPQTAPAPAPQAQAPAPAKASAPAKAAAAPVAARPAWEQKWEETLAAAKHEGRAVVYGSFSADERTAMMKGIKEAYGIDGELITGIVASYPPKWAAERKAGLYLNDLYLGGYNTILLQVKPAGMTESLEPALILPDVTDPERIKKVWYRGVLPWVDKDHTLLVTSLQPRPVIAINTNLVKEGEIKSYRDLLNPKWKDKLVQHDPTQAGGGRQVLQAMMVIMGDDFIKELAKMQPTLTRDKRQALDWLAFGKFAILIAPDGESMKDYVQLGAPMKDVTPVEGVYMSAASTGLTIFNRPAHPNAAKVFVNWLTSKEGQELYAPSGNYHSLRLDVSAAHLRPDQKRQEGVKYYDASTEEASTTDSARAAKLAQDAYGPLVK